VATETTLTGMRDALRLAELLCARLCHDLAGPLGSLIGVIEIAREEQTGSETLAVAEETVVELGERLKLLRAAWGQDDEELDVIRLQKFGDGLGNGRKLRLDINGVDPEAIFPPPAARVILNLLLLAAESLPGGGLITLSGSPADHVLVTITGPRAAWPAGFAGCLMDEAAAWAAATASPRGLQAPLTALVARECGYQLSLLLSSEARKPADCAPPLLLSFET
jgi:histidine phosphotransferase ChpT